MPTYLLKPDRDLDYYVEWSTVVDAPVWTGPRPTCLTRHSAETVERVDDTGTSAHDPAFYGYNDSGMVFGGRWWLPRRHLTTLAHLAEEGVPGDDPRLRALLEDPQDHPDKVIFLSIGGEGTS